MAKKSKEQEQIDPTLGFIEQVRKQIDKEYGKDVLVDASDISKERDEVLSWSPSLDILLSGGVPEGCWVSISGKPKTGKTTSALTFAAEAQKQGRVVYYFNVEARLKDKNIYGVKSLDTSPEKFQVIRSTKGKILSTLDYLKIAEMVIKTHPKAVLIFDSISAMVDAKQLTNGIGTELRGHNSHIITQFVDNVCNTVPIMKSIVIGITHIIANTGFGAPTAEKAANRWLYQSDIRMLLKYSSGWVVGNREIGKVMHMQVQESALGAPNMMGDSYLRYGVGIDKVYEAFKLGSCVGLITQAGPWYTLTFLEEEGKETPKFQGADSAYKALLENSEWQDKLNTRLKEFTDLLIDTMATSKEEDKK